MNDPDHRGSSVAKLIHRFRHGQAAEKSLRRKEVEDLMWWHATKNATDSQAGTSSVVGTPDPPSEVHASATTSAGKRMLDSSLGTSENLSDSSCGTRRGKVPLQALLTLAKTNPSLYKALMNLQMSPSGSVSSASVSLVQQIVSASETQKQPRVASNRHESTGKPHSKAVRPSSSRPISQHHMIAANGSLLLSSGPQVPNDPDAEPEPSSPSASLKEWASGTCSPNTRSSSPADRFAGLQVHLPPEHQIRSSSERSSSCSTSPPRADTSSRRTRNVDGEPYHPLARDYPPSSSAGSMWSPGSAPRARQHSSLSSRGSPGVATPAYDAEADASALPVADDVMRGKGRPHQESATDPKDGVRKNGCSLDEFPGPGDAGSDSESVYQPSTCDCNNIDAVKRVHSLYHTDSSGDSGVSSPLLEHMGDAEPSELCTQAVGTKPGLVLDLFDHDLVINTAAECCHNGQSANQSPRCEPLQRTADDDQVSQEHCEAVSQHEPLGHQLIGPEGQATLNAGEMCVEQRFTSVAATLDSSVVDTSDTSVAASNASQTEDPSVQPERDHDSSNEKGCREGQLAAPLPAVTLAEESSVSTNRYCVHEPDATPQLAQVPMQYGLVEADNAAGGLDCSGPTVLPTDQGPKSLELMSTTAAGAKLLCSADAAQTQPRHAVQLEPAYSSVQDSADACAQASETSSPPVARRTPNTCKRDPGYRQAMPGLLELTEAGQRCQQDAAVQSDLAYAIQQQKCTALGADSTATQTDRTAPAAMTSPRSLRSPHDEYGHAQLPSCEDDACISAWPPSAARVLAAGPPDPGVLLAVQGVRAQIEALNHEMASVMIHTQGVSVMEEPVKSEADTLQFVGDMSSKDCMDTDGNLGTAAPDVSEQPCTFEWDVMPAVNNSSQQQPQPIRISLSVVTVAADKAMHNVHAPEARSHAHQAPEHPVAELNAEDQLLPKKQRSIEHEDKACQAFAEDFPTSASVTAFASQVSQTSDSVATASAGCGHNDCGNDDRSYKEKHSATSSCRETGVMDAAGMSGDHGYCGSRVLTDAFVPCVMNPALRLGAGGMPWIFDPMGCGSEFDTGPSRGLEMPVDEPGMHGPGGECYDEMNKAPDHSSIPCPGVSEAAGTGLYALDGAPCSQIRPLMNSMSLSTSRTKHLKTL